MPNLGLGEAAFKTAMAAYFLMWGLFTFVMFIGTHRINRALQFVFLSFAVLFFLLAIRDLTVSGSIATLAGYEGIICRLSAVYTGLSQVINRLQQDRGTAGPCIE